MIITLSRQMGSLGDDIAARVAAELGLALADRELIREAALAAGVSADLLQRLMYEEPRSLAAEVIEGLGSVSTRFPSGGISASNPLGAIFAPPLQPVSVGLEEGARAVGQVIRNVADRGNVLILGQGGQIFLRGRPATLHVQLVAPLEQRVARVAKRDAISDVAARHRVRASDSGRADYLARYHGANWLDPVLYHVVINTGMVSVEDAVSTIACLARLVEREI